MRSQKKLIKFSLTGIVPVNATGIYRASTKSAACFGCSAGKAEINFVMRSLKSGRETSEILMDLNSPIIIDVFADYTNKDIAKVWKLVKAVSRKLNQNRVVLRTPGLTPEARRAVQVAEYARLNGNFSMVQDALIKHNGPWDWSTHTHTHARAHARTDARTYTFANQRKQP